MHGYPTLIVRTHSTVLSCCWHCTNETLIVYVPKCARWLR